MLFDNFLQGLSGEPAFNCFRKKDFNPLAGTTKFRLLHNPNKPMRQLHRKIKEYLRSLDINREHMKGCLPGNSPVKNIKAHGLARYFYWLDIHDAYPSVDGAKLMAILCHLDSRLVGQEAEVQAFLARYCLSERGGLAVGAPASPDLFNVYAGKLLDVPLADFLNQQESFIQYTRYLDDLIFSSRATIGAKKRRAIRQIVENAGMQINHPKSRVFDLGKGPVVINGVGLAEGGRIFLPRHYLRKIRGLLHRAMEKRDISLERIAGFMGVFWELTNRRHPNRTELGVIRLYRKYRYQLKLEQPL